MTKPYSCAAVDPVGLEPSSPLPILLKRAKRLVGADFMEIINDLAPSGVDNVKLIGGVTEEETVTATEEASSDW